MSDRATPVPPLDSPMPTVEVQNLDSTVPAIEIRNLDDDWFNLTKRVAIWFLTLFAISTISIIGLIVYLSYTDMDMIAHKLIAPADRLVTENVIMTVVGATYVQVGAGMILIVQSLFKARTTIHPVNTSEGG